jgi:hypothetical protein
MFADKYWVMVVEFDIMQVIHKKQVTTMLFLQLYLF